MSHKKHKIPDGTREVVVSCSGYAPGKCDFPNGQKCVFAERFTVVLPYGENSISLGECQHTGKDQLCVKA